MAYIEIKDLSFSYPQSKGRSLNQINLTIEQGEYVTICGKSGSGKTTLLRHLKGAFTPHGTVSGEILFQGKPLKEYSLREQTSKIGFVMQNPESQVVTDKVWHELAFGLESLSYDQSAMRLRVAEMASYFGLESWFEKDVNSLSGGQKQLLNLASIMAMQPEVLILDEPASQLDPVAASDFLTTVKKLNQDLGITILISEHRLEQVMACSDRVIVMDGGTVIANADAHQVGGILKNSNHDMYQAMPAPVKIYYSVENGMECPITVGEGRKWLSKKYEMETPSVNRIKDNKEKNVSKPSVIEVNEVWFRYEKNGIDILKGCSFSVPEGSFSAIMGGNGTGKSTLLRIICGIHKPYRGKIKIKGKSLAKYKDSELFHENVALLCQDPKLLFVKKTVREELEEMISFKHQKDDLLDEYVKLVEIEDLLDRHPYDLSGGEQQRVALAKVLMTKPKILLLDEPTKGLDNFFKEKLARLLCELKRKGTTILMVSHDVEFCAQYTDQVSLLFQGEVATTCTPYEFFLNNSFYTTAANRMCRTCFRDVVTTSDAIRQIEQREKIK